MPDFKQGLTQITSIVSKRKTLLWTGLYILTLSYFIGKTGSLLVGSHFFPLQLEQTQGQNSTARRMSRPKTSIQKIRSRNLFDSNAQNRKQKVRQPAVTDDREIRPSSISAELLGTVVFQNSRYSVALIRNRSKNTTSYYSIGDSLLGTSVVRIERFRIIVQKSGRLESLEIQAAKSKLAARAPSAGSQKKGSSDKVDFEELGPGRFLIPQETLDGLLGNLPDIMRSARAVPVTGPNNKIDGFKLVEIKKDSIFEKIGLENQDVIKSVNDEDLDSFEKGMTLFNALRLKKTISIDIERGGSRLNYTYEIR